MEVDVADIRHPDEIDVRTSANDAPSAPTPLAVLEEHAGLLAERDPTCVSGREPDRPHLGLGRGLEEVDSNPVAVDHANAPETRRRRISSDVANLQRASPGSTKSISRSTLLEGRTHGA